MNASLHPTFANWVRQSAPEKVDELEKALEAWLSTGGRRPGKLVDVFTEVLGDKWMLWLTFKRITR